MASSKTANLKTAAPNVNNAQPIAIGVTGSVAPIDPLQICVAQSFAQAPSETLTKRPIKIAIALSGGRDSIALLHVLHHWSQSDVVPDVQLIAISIDHGLQANSNQWLKFCGDVCSGLGIAHFGERVLIDLSTPKSKEQGVEAAAREVRYKTLCAIAVQQHCQVIAFAQHQNDQAETVLLQLLRGTGLSGAAAMQTWRELGFKSQGGLYAWRPWLNITREQIDNYIARNELNYVDDPSNLNTQFARNVLRHKVMPQIEQYFPSARVALTRFAKIAAQALTQIEFLAQEDLASCSQVDEQWGATVRASHLALLSPVRQAWVLRLWLKNAGLRAPSQARLGQMLSQLLHAKSDAQILLAYQGKVVRRFKDSILLVSANTASRLPQYRSVQFESVTAQDAPGLPPQLVAQGGFEFRSRSGAERLKIAPNRPTRTLKNLFQELGIAPWQREQTLCLYQHSQLLWVSGIGFDCRFALTHGERFQPVVFSPL